MLVDFCLFFVSSCSFCGPPFVWRHTCECLENTEEGGFVGKARTEKDFSNLYVWLLTHQLHGLFNTVSVDEVGEGIASRIPDAFREVTAADAESIGKVRHLQFAIQVWLLLSHKLTEALHEFVVYVGLRGSLRL